ncbi:S66 peptidase family protein [Desulfogranum japonicum]|uniref:S66 peptidase family protein n=1 Tax=Desulfogranum japonicum TaxID=231447 RepID=UPI00040840AC|nr:LD-carboxypeptidase [Desulfogranum japonicum]
MPRPVFPRRLRRGDTIGLFCPAGPIHKSMEMERGIRVLTSMGFQVTIHGNMQCGHPYLADTDQARANAFLSLWHDEEVQALMAVRGGFGCMRLMDYLGLDSLQGQPKLLIGFSDITALLQGLLVHGNIVGIHGPVVTSLADQDENSTRSFFSLVTGEINTPIMPLNLEILRSGDAQGPLVGGNLTTLIHLMGTPWECPWDGAVLVLEDTGEVPYRLDRMLTQLACSGRLANLAGIILGTFDQGKEMDSLELLRLQEQVWTRVLELTQAYGYPVWGNFPIGHQKSNVGLPIGMEVQMNSSTGQLQLLQESVTLL